MPTATPIENALELIEAAKNTAALAARQIETPSTEIGSAEASIAIIRTTLNSAADQLFLHRPPDDERTILSTEDVDRLAKASRKITDAGAILRTVLYDLDPEAGSNRAKSDRETLKQAAESLIEESALLVMDVYENGTRVSP